MRQTISTSVVGKIREVRSCFLTKLFTFLILSQLFFGCSDSNSDLTKGGVLKYFDLKGYFEQETSMLKNHQKVKKIASVDGVREERMLDSIDFEQELKIFSNADINRPAWSDKYTIDSVFTNDRQLVQLNYATKDLGLRTKKITIDFKDGDVSKVFIENGTTSALAETTQLLTYQPNFGYTIESKQQIAVSDDNLFVVEVQFLNQLE